MEEHDRISSIEHFDVYHEYAKTLRTWLVGFGVGAPVIFLTQDFVRQMIIDTAWHGLLISLFLLGVGCQVVLALVNKWINWYLYFCQDQGQIDSPTYDRVKSFSQWYMFDLMLDVITVVCFAVSSIWTAILLR